MTCYAPMAKAFRALFFHSKSITASVLSPWYVLLRAYSPGRPGMPEKRMTAKRSSLLCAEKPAQQTPQGPGRLPDNDPHTLPLSAAATTAASAGNEKERDQKQQRPHRKDGRYEDPRSQGDAEDAQKASAAVSTKHSRHAPFSLPQYIRRDRALEPGKGKFSSVDTERLQELFPAAFPCK